MEIKKENITVRGIKFSVVEGGKERARAFLYIMKNNLHNEPFGLMEDVFVDESFRGSGLGTALVEKVIQEAKNCGCYKLIATSRDSRPRVHELYKRLGFELWGVEFRMNF